MTGVLTVLVSVALVAGVAFMAVCAAVAPVGRVERAFCVLAGAAGGMSLGLIASGALRS